MVSARVLVVEDEAIVAMGIKHKLENMGHTVVEMVASGENAIRAAKEHYPDIILMDIVIKGDMDGIDAAKIIHDTNDIPIIYLTAYADDEILERARVTQPYGYIIKPFKSSELNANIEMALYKHQTAKKETEIIKQQVAADFNEFISQTLPTGSTPSEIEMRDMLFNIFGDRLEDDYKPSYESTIKSAGIDDDSDGGEILEAYLPWLSDVFNDFGVRNAMKPKESDIDFEFDNCPWKEDAEKNPIFCINCHSVIKRSFEWTNLEGKIERKHTIATGADHCLFVFKF